MQSLCTLSFESLGMYNGMCVLGHTLVHTVVHAVHGTHLYDVARPVLVLAPGYKIGMHGSGLVVKAW